MSLASFSYLLYAVALFYVSKRILKSYLLSKRLTAIPSVGPNSDGFITSYIGAIRYFKHAKEIVQEGYDKHPGHAFKLPTLNSWQIVISGPKMLDELQRAPDDQLSTISAVIERLQLNYTMGWQPHFNSYLVDVIRNSLTRNIAARFDDVKDEVVQAFADEIPLTKDWTPIPVMETVVRIVVRTSNRLFMGLPMCRNPELTKLSIELTEKVFVSAQIIHCFPDFLKPIVARLFTNASGQLQEGIEVLGPLIQARLDADEMYGQDREGRPNDLISWLLDNAPPHQKTIGDLTLRILMIIFSAIHASSIAFTTALYALAASPPDVIDALREEIKGIIEDEGWTKTSMVKMRKLDSFLKESIRLYGTNAVLMDRKALKDFVFSDGTVIPAGCFVSVATHATHFDNANYNKAEEFKPFRFCDSSSSVGTDSQMVSTHPDWLGFGYGRHACPGRYFAVNEIKTMMAYTLLNYDVQFADGQTGIPERKWFTALSYPDPTVKVLFRARAGQKV